MQGPPSYTVPPHAHVAAAHTRSVPAFASAATSACSASPECTPTIVCVTQPQPVAEVAEAEDANGTPAWAMAAASLAAALALPGIAMFQAGLLRAGSVNTLLLHHVTIAAVGFLLWVAAGFSATVSRTGMSAGSLGLRSVLGAFDMAMLKGVFSSAQAAVDPAQLLRVAHSLVPALLAPCIVVGVAAERMKATAMTMFSILWLPVVYIPVAHAAGAGPGGLLWDLHLLDGAGSIALNTAAGFSAVMLARVVGARRKPGRGSHNLPSTVLGTALLAVGLLAHMAGACVTGTSAVTTLVAAQVRMSCCRFAANQIIWKALCDLWFV